MRKRFVLLSTLGWVVIVNNVLRILLQRKIKKVEISALISTLIFAICDSVGARTQDPRLRRALL